MNSVAVPRSGPSLLHESRVETLETLATLCGFEYGPSVLLDGSRPDVLRLRTTDRGLFIGDAKATETPCNTETYERLGRYVRFIAMWTEAGYSAILALAVGPPDAFGWIRTVRALAAEFHGGELRQPGLADLDPTTAVIEQEFAERGYSRRNST